MKYTSRLSLVIAASLTPTLASAQPAAPAAPAPEATPPPAAVPDEPPVPRVTAPPPPVSAPTTPAGAPIEAPVEAAPVVPELSGLAIRGRVTIAGSDTPLAFVEVSVRLPDGTTRTEMVGEDGTFTIAGLAAGRYVVRVETEGFAARQVTVDLGPGDATANLAVASSETIEITERWRGQAQAMRESAEVVTVIETDQAKRESADLGEVLARVQGVGMRRAGGLGSASRLSLGGLVDEQVRIFIDGIPIQLAGFRSGITTIPVSFVDRIEIYRGVVPVRFGADSLGGAINFVTNRQWTRTQAAGSVQAGSFGTERVTGAVRGRLGDVLASADLFFDDAANDYDIDVEVPDDRGQLSPATVARSNDSYRAYGAFAEVGVVDQPWARRLTLRGFATQYDKDLPHNAVMTVPYGEVRYGGSSLGGMARWEQPDVGGSALDVDTVAAYAFNTTDFVDKSMWVYDWFGQRVRERRTAGETSTMASDQTVWEHNASTITNLAYQFDEHHALRGNVTLNVVRRTGRERILSSSSSRDPESARRVLGKNVYGIEYVLDGFDNRLENVAFLKAYGYVTSVEEVLAGNIFRARDRRDLYGGVGDSVRWRFTPSLWAKASYEYTTRLPDAVEVFGDAVLIAANLGLRPERSQNVNLGVTVDHESRFGRVLGDLNLIARIVRDQVVLLGNDRTFTFQNVYGANGYGPEVALSWSSPGEWLTVSGNGYYLDMRNSSGDGTFGAFDGDRIPSRPWLAAAGSVSFFKKDLVVAKDSITAGWNSTFVYEFYRGWESQGAREFKQVVPTQFLQNVVLTYLLDRVVDTSFSVEMANITDAKAYDFFGVQKPGRAISFKTTITY
jgi:vitamin B12 transporter